MLAEPAGPVVPSGRPRRDGTAGGAEDRAFAALADPTRRRIVELLLGEERTAGEIAEEFPVSRPAISRHLRVLRESGLVRYRGDGARRLYTLDTQPLEALDGWLSRYRRSWARLDAPGTPPAAEPGCGAGGPAPHATALARGDRDRRPPVGRPAEIDSSAGPG